LGGGITIEKEGPFPLDGLKAPDAIQCAYHFASISLCE
jgi:hypothetical protein